MNESERKILFRVTGSELRLWFWCDFVQVMVAGVLWHLTEKFQSAPLYMFTLLFSGCMFLGVIFLFLIFLSVCIVCGTGFGIKSITVDDKFLKRRLRGISTVSGGDCARYWHFPIIGTVILSIEEKQNDY